MRIAVIGTGISGMTAARLLCDDHELVVYEKRRHVGGHTHTQDVALEASTFVADTGFTLFNERQYPNFTKLLKRVGARWREAPRGFAVRCDRSGIEFAVTSIRGLFAQRRNLLRSWFFRMLRDAVRFRDACIAAMADGHDDLAVGKLVQEGRYEEPFSACFLRPLCSAVLPADRAAPLELSLRSFVEFLDRHCVFDDPGPPHWLVFPGGARMYALRLVEPYQAAIRANCAVKTVKRNADCVEVASADGAVERFDHVVIATAADEALAMLAEASNAEQAVLSAFTYGAREAVLHCDHRVVPQRDTARAGWSLHVPADETARPVFSYDLGFLQGGPHAPRVCVTLDPGPAVDPRKVLRTVELRCPLDTPEARAAQKRHGEISGINRTSFCGAHWGLGVHEDGVNSALEVCKPFGKGL